MKALRCAFFLRKSQFLGLLPCLPLAAQISPTITRQPASLSRSLGDKAVFSVTATGDTPFTYQWRLNQSDLLNATNRILTVTNLVKADAGAYSVVVSNVIGSAASDSATLEVDGLFTLLADSPISRVAAYGMAWGDYDDDGFPDLIATGSSSFFVYHNERNGSFTRVTTNAIARLSFSAGSIASGYWADFNNDGNLDFFAPTGWGVNDPKILVRGLGGGRFESIVNDPVVKDRSSAWSAAWGDFNRDGQLDLFIANGRDANGSESAENAFYLGQTNGTFLRWHPPGLADFRAKSYGCTVGDFDGDGFPDVAFAARDLARTMVFQNHGGTDFEAVLLGGGGGSWGGVAAADLNNDGRLDLLTTWASGTSAVFWNSGPGVWDPAFDAEPLLDPSRTESAALGDFNNDGWVDIFLPRSNQAIGSGDQNDTLWQNNGDGTFTRVEAGSLTHDGLSSHGAAWADLDNDGFLDLAVSALDDSGADRSRLFHNNGNANGWLLLKLIGTRSNRSAIGAKVRLTATLRNQKLTQFREVGTSTGLGQNDLRVHFGLADAAMAEQVEIEWPSGRKQILTKVIGRQILTVTEPDDRFRMSIQRDLSSSLQVTLQGSPGTSVLLERSADLQGWSEETRATIKADGTVAVKVTNGAGAEFFRARVL